MAGVGYVPIADAKERQRSIIWNQKAKEVQVWEVTWFLPVANVITPKVLSLG